MTKTHVLESARHPYRNFSSMDGGERESCAHAYLFATFGIILLRTINVLQIFFTLVDLIDFFINNVQKI